MPQTRPQGFATATIDSRKQCEQRGAEERTGGGQRVGACLKSQFAVGIANKT